jgi:hypothetical protein
VSTDALCHTIAAALPQTTFYLANHAKPEYFAQSTTVAANSQSLATAKLFLVSSAYDQALSTSQAGTPLGNSAWSNGNLILYHELRRD